MQINQKLNVEEINLLIILIDLARIDSIDEKIRNTLIFMRRKLEMIQDEASSHAIHGI